MNRFIDARHRYRFALLGGVMGMSLGGRAGRSGRGCFKNAGVKIGGTRTPEEKGVIFFDVER